jgi:hypothetical protein
LVPIQIEIASFNEDLIERCQDSGIEARMIGPKQLAIDALPEWLSIDDAGDFLMALQDSSLSIQEIILSFYRTRKISFTLEEAKFLWREGKGKEIVLSENDLEQLWARKFS